LVFVSCIHFLWCMLRAEVYLSACIHWFPKRSYRPSVPVWEEQQRGDRNCWSVHDIDSSGSPPSEGLPLFTSKSPLKEVFSILSSYPGHISRNPLPRNKFSFIYIYKNITATMFLTCNISGIIIPDGAQEKPANHDFSPTQPQRSKILLSRGKNLSLSHLIVSDIHTLCYWQRFWRDRVVNAADTVPKDEGNSTD